MTEPQPALNVIHGWPDDQRVLGSISETGAYVITRFGTPSLLDHIPRRNTVDIWLGPGTPSQSAFTARPTLNYIADPDLCSRALAAAVRLSETVSVPWLNHPRSVLNNTRDKLALALAGIPGIVVPRTLRLAAPGLAAIKKGRPGRRSALPRDRSHRRPAGWRRNRAGAHTQRLRPPPRDPLGRARPLRLGIHQHPQCRWTLSQTPHRW